MKKIVGFLMMSALAFGLEIGVNTGYYSISTPKNADIQLHNLSEYWGYAPSPFFVKKIYITDTSGILLAGLGTGANKYTAEKNAVDNAYFAKGQTSTTVSYSYKV